MSRETAIRKWAARFDTNVLSKPEFAHLRPYRTQQDVTVEEALGAEYETTSLSDCALAFLRPLKSLCTRYPSERGERAVLNCLTSAVIKRFVKGKDKGVPGLILEDVLLAEELAAEVMRRSGSVEQSSGEYQFAYSVTKRVDKFTYSVTKPVDNRWVYWTTQMEASKPEWPKKSDFVTAEQYDEAMGLAEQEWWEVWVNEIEKAWECYAHDAIPVHLCEPIVRQEGQDMARLLNYKRQDGKGFDMGGRTVDDYRGPMDWVIPVTFNLLILSQMTLQAHDVGIEWMDKVVRERLETPRACKQPWLTARDLKNAIRDLAKELEAKSKVDTPMED